MVFFLPKDQAAKAIELRLNENTDTKDIPLKKYRFLEACIQVEADCRSAVEKPIKRRQLQSYIPDIIAHIWKDDTAVIKTRSGISIIFPPDSVQITPAKIPTLIHHFDYAYDVDAIVVKSNMIIKSKETNITRPRFQKSTEKPTLPEIRDAAISDNLDEYIERFKATDSKYLEKILKRAKKLGYLDR